MLQEIINELVKAQSSIKENEQMKVEIKELEEARDKYKKDAATIQAQLNEANEQLENDNGEGFVEVDLGLDTVYYKLRSGNLQISTRLESALQEINTIPNSHLIFP